MRPPTPNDPAWVARYRVLGRLGSGGMGTVLLGRGPDGGLVAVKLIRPEHADDPAFRQRFRREVTVARQVRSPWAVPVIDADADAVSPWLATPFVPGPALDATVATTGPLPEASVRVLGARLAEALAAVHGAGLVHRDVKPGNVLLAHDGPRLIDFGIARALEETVLTATGSILGSPGYLSPEQARGLRVGPASDVFSLGCVLAHAVTGQRPFGVGPVEALLYRAVHDEPDLTGVPEGLRPLLVRCLAKDASARPTVGALRAAWGEADHAAGDGWLPAPVIQLIAERSARMLQLPPVEPTQPGTARQRPPSRRRLLLGAAGAAAGIAAGGGALWWASRGQEVGATPPPDPQRPLVTVGLQADLSGPRARAGTAYQRGAELAVARHNADDKRPFGLALRIEDDAGTAEAAERVARALAADDAVVAVVTATGPEATGALLPPYVQVRKPVLDLTDGSIAHLNAVHTIARPPDALQLRPVVTLLTAGPLAGPLVVVDDTTPYSWDITRNARAALGAGGPEVVAEVVPAGEADPNAAASRIAAHAPGAVLYGGSWEAAGPFAAALQAAGYRGPRLGTQGMHDPGFLDLAGPAADGWLLTSTVTDPLAAPGAEAFVEAFTAHFDEPPPPHAAEGYDALGLLARCLTGLDPAALTHRDVVEVLRLTSHQGVAKHLAFEEENGLFVGEGVFFYRVEGGAFTFLGDEPPAAL
ncbi:bifunctional serine/threonine-protein kinase/ABC transporter substrate-binding protein [Streptomyces sp. DSM 44915]|uniref:Bifunctional serine/threonine-protein kinase/ABC transporter substrate-binding protein n=1 Tax=Streptomyces chisholmiae TaxID=3075540 RepID=A0ABU2JR54_9ACTN|nr:bifunctional serine/threonine-protein kinase/ABC transporter substrate-binding protein [Streptomyces sp. DSM 44915]MDT0267460.1 bifunctional serine/threonine-protein kinase/ABC transporter substrate-binding protein [Streptomyces sp. DSM 44915]